jgi:hypothetical protein
MAKKKFPERLYVKRENAGTGDEYLQCGETFGELVDANETKELAVYELVEVGKATMSPGYKKLRAVK